MGGFEVVTDAERDDVFHTMVNCKSRVSLILTPAAILLFAKSFPHRMPDFFIVKKAIADNGKSNAIVNTIVQGKVTIPLFGVLSGEGSLLVQCPMYCSP